MGPPGLWRELRRRGGGRELKGADAEQFVEGRKVAVDAAIWFYEAQQQQRLQLVMEPRRAVLKVVFERCSRWLRKGVLPIVVLEGGGGGRADRRARGGAAAAKLNAALSAPAPEVRRLLAGLGVPCITAEGEAEATCAALAARGYCDFVATTDADALLFGAPVVLKGLDLQAESSASIVEVWELSAMESSCGVSREILVATAALMGSDYDTGVNKVGVRGALNVACRLHRQNPNGALAALDNLLQQDSLPPELAMVLEGPPPSRAGRGRGGGRGRGRGGAKAKAKAKALSASGTGMQRTSFPIALRRASVGGRRCARTVGHALAQPESLAALRHVVAQFTRSADSAIAAALAGPGQAPLPQPSSQSFLWKGVDQAAAIQVLSKLYVQDTVVGKLLPLELEWALRHLAAEKVEAARATEEGRREWARERQLRYWPRSARRCRKRSDEAAADAAAGGLGGTGDAEAEGEEDNFSLTQMAMDVVGPTDAMGPSRSPEAIVAWEAVEAGTVLPIEATKHRVRLDLAEACSLLPLEGSEASELRKSVAWTSKNSPSEVRSSLAQLIKWANRQHRRLPFLPIVAEPVQPRRPRGPWTVTWAASRSEFVQLAVQKAEKCEKWQEKDLPSGSAELVSMRLAWKVVEAFGGFLVRSWTLADSTTPSRQKSLFEFMSPGPRAPTSGRSLDLEGAKADTSMAPAAPTTSPPPPARARCMTPRIATPKTPTLDFFAAPTILDSGNSGNNSNNSNTGSNSISNSNSNANTCSSLHHKRRLDSRREIQDEANMFSQPQLPQPTQPPQPQPPFDADGACDSPPRTPARASTRRSLIRCDSAVSYADTEGARTPATPFDRIILDSDDDDEADHVEAPTRTEKFEEATPVGIGADSIPILDPNPVTVPSMNSLASTFFASNSDTIANLELEVARARSAAATALAAAAATASAATASAATASAATASAAASAAVTASGIAPPPPGASSSSPLKLSWIAAAAPSAPAALMEGRSSASPNDHRYQHQDDVGSTPQTPKSRRQRRSSQTSRRSGKQEEPPCSLISSDDEETGSGRNASAAADAAALTPPPCRRRSTRNSTGNKDSTVTADAASLSSPCATATAAAAAATPARPSQRDGVAPSPSSSSPQIIVGGPAGSVRCSSSTASLSSLPGLPGRRSSAAANPPANPVIANPPVNVNTADAAVIAEAAEAAPAQAQALAWRPPTLMSTCCEAAAAPAAARAGNETPESVATTVQDESSLEDQQHSLGLCESPGLHPTSAPLAPPQQQQQHSSVLEMASPLPAKRSSSSSSSRRAWASPLKGNSEVLDLAAEEDGSSLKTGAARGVGICDEASLLPRIELGSLTAEIGEEDKEIEIEIVKVNVKGLAQTSPWCLPHSWFRRESQIPLQTRMRLCQNNDGGEVSERLKRRQAKRHMTLEEPQERKRSNTEIPPGSSKAVELKMEPLRSQAEASAGADEDQEQAGQADRDEAAQRLRSRRRLADVHGAEMELEDDFAGASKLAATSMISAAGSATVSTSPGPMLGSSRGLTRRRWALGALSSTGMLSVTRYAPPTTTTITTTTTTAATAVAATALSH